MRTLTRTHTAVRTALRRIVLADKSMPIEFTIQPPDHYAGVNEPVKRPREFTCFSYDRERRFHLGDRSLKWFYPAYIPSDLSRGYQNWQRHDDSIDEHLDGLLAAIADYEKQTGKPIDAHVTTWRGMMTKIMATPYDQEEWEMNATFYRGCIFIEENHAFARRKKMMESSRPARSDGISPNLMQYWGYKFETLSTIPRPWGEVSRDEIESRDDEIVNNMEQYCSVVRTGFGNTIVCLGGEVDAIWDAKPETPGEPINWVELKTSRMITNTGIQTAFDQKLLKYWIQSFLLGVPRIIVGFRDQDGILRSMEEYETLNIPYEVRRRGLAKWDGNVCIRFAALFLQWLRLNITEEGVWRIRRPFRGSRIELTKIEQVGHGAIITEEFMNWRIKLDLQKAKQQALEEGKQDQGEEGQKAAAPAAA